jgi:hypothetical protein
VNLRLDHHRGRAGIEHLLGEDAGAFDGFGHHSARDGGLEVGEDLLGLKLVNVHFFNSFLVEDFSLRFNAKAQRRKEENF